MNNKIKAFVRQLKRIWFCNILMYYFKPEYRFHTNKHDMCKDCNSNVEGHCYVQ